MQGKRDAYAFTLTLNEINELLPRRSDDTLNAIHDANRALAPHHAAAIKSYLQRTSDWVLGPLTLAIHPDAVTYDAGELAVTPDAKHPLMKGGPLYSEVPLCALDTNLENVIGFGSCDPQWDFTIQWTPLHFGNIQKVS